MCLIHIAFAKKTSYHLNISYCSIFFDFDQNTIRGEWKLKLFQNIILFVSNLRGKQEMI